MGSRGLKWVLVSLECSIQVASTKSFATSAGKENILTSILAAFSQSVSEQNSLFLEQCASLSVMSSQATHATDTLTQQK